MKKLTEFLTAVCFFFLSAAVLLTSVDMCCFDQNFYRKEYEKEDAMSETGMSLSSLMDATDVLLDYLRDERGDIVVEEEVSGTRREVFNSREIRHMEDVKALYHNAMIFRNTAWICCIVFLLILFLKDRKNFRTYCQNGFIYGITLAVMMMLFLLIWCAGDFSAFWIAFHELFFDNDYFYLDPNTSIMINMFPGNFFLHLVIKIVIVWALILTVIGLVLFAGRKKHA